MRPSAEVLPCESDDCQHTTRGNRKNNDKDNRSEQVEIPQYENK